MEKKLNLEKADGETLIFVQDLVSEIYGKSLKDQAKDVAFEQTKYYNLRRRSVSSTASKKALKELLRIHPAIVLARDIKGIVNFAQSSTDIQEFAKGRGYYAPGSTQDAQQGNIQTNDTTTKDVLINRLEKENAELREKLLILKERLDLQRTEEELTKLIALRKQQLVDLEELRMEQKRMIQKVFAERI
jgi:hypothetical protein